jgi:lipoate-protein ligase A
MKKMDLTFDLPAENLACDEALLDRCEDEGGPEVLRFWEPRDYFVVLGYSNKLAAEVNQIPVSGLPVPALRRSSGGGTVLQGPGCLNYALVLKIDGSPERANVTSVNRYAMEKNRSALERLLKKPVRVQGHTDLTLGDLKFSGNAQRRKRNAFLFHGTFLLDFNLEKIEAHLKMPEIQPDYRQKRGHRHFLVNLGVPAEKVKAALAEEWNAAGELAAPGGIRALASRYPGL